MISSGPQTAQGAPAKWRRSPALLDRTHRFLTTRQRPDIESAADRFFHALGYRRRADEGKALVFERGRRFASLYSASLRACCARVEVELEPGGDTGVLIVRHQVETLGRLLLAEDLDLLDAEARALERFLEDGDIDTDALLEAARRASRPGALLTAAAVVGLMAATAVVLVVYALK